MKHMVFDTDWLSENEFALDDEMENLGTKTVGTILVIADLCLWNGRMPGFRFLEGTNTLAATLKVFQGDSYELYVEGENLKGEDIHHDGTNFYAFYEVVDMDAAEKIADLVYNGREIPDDLFRKGLRSLGPDVSDIYGFEKTEGK